MKAVFFSLLFGFLGITTLQAEGTGPVAPPRESQPNDTMSQPMEAAPQAKEAMPKPTPSMPKSMESMPQHEEALPMSCSELTQEEQAFSKELAAKYQKVFCTQMTETQRMMALQMKGKVDAEGNAISANQAVAKVAEQFEIPIPEVSPQTQEQTPSMGCPVQK